MAQYPFRSFPKELEQEFQQHYADRSVPVARLGALLGATLYLVFILWDIVVDVDVAAKAAIIRVLVAAYLVGVSVLLIKKPLLRYMQQLLAFGVSIAGLGVVVIIFFMKNGLNVGLGGIVLTLMFAFGFLRLLFIPSIISGVLVVLFYNSACVIAQLPTTVLVTNNFFLVSAIFAGATITYTLEDLFRRQFLSEKEISIERSRTNALIDNMLPQHIANRLKGGEKIIAESHGEATVLFADLVGFTSLTRRLSPSHLIELLNDIFSIFDELTDKHHVEKVKTVGDAYMAVSGVNRGRQHSAEAIADFALDIIRTIEEYARAKGYPLGMRVGIATGQLISGVIGLRKLSFDLWGDTVNLASRMETHSQQGCIQVTETTYWRLRDNYILESKGKVDLEGIGPVETYGLIGRKVPNDPRVVEFPKVASQGNG